MTWGVNSYNATPSGNSTINGINIAEGCNASGINDAIRQLMADLATQFNTAAVLGGTLTYGGVVISNTPTGTGNMVLSASPTFSGAVTFPDSAIWNSSGLSGLTALTVGTGGTSGNQVYAIVNGGNGSGGSHGLKIQANASTVAQFYYDINSGQARISVGGKDPAITIAATTGALAFKGYGAGTLTTDASGNVTASSDERLKDVEGPYTRGLADVLKINTSQWRWNEASGLDGSRVMSGFTAQAVQAGVPEAVFQGPDGYLTIHDPALIAALINAVKELAAKVGAT